MTATTDLDYDDYDDLDRDQTGETPIVDAPPEGQERQPRRFRIRVSDLDLRNTWQVVVGAILLPLGIAIIIIGWHGAAYGKVDQQQIPYLISGGILGLAIVLIGCFFFWAHWLYRIYDQADLHHQTAMREQTELMRALLEAMRAGPLAGGNGADGNGTAPRRAAPAGTFVATSTGTNFHVRSCPVLASRASSVRSISADEAAQMKPCRICEPLAAFGSGSA